MAEEEAATADTAGGAAATSDSAGATIYDFPRGRGHPRFQTSARASKV